MAGEFALQQEQPDGVKRLVVLRLGDYAINERGPWHAAKVGGEATALFITVGAELSIACVERWRLAGDFRCCPNCDLQIRP